jgi:hypothetical protein
MPLLTMRTPAEANKIKRAGKMNKPVTVSGGLCFCPKSALIPCTNTSLYPGSLFR